MGNNFTPVGGQSLTMEIFLLLHCKNVLGLIELLVSTDVGLIKLLVFTDVGLIKLLVFTDVKRSYYAISLLQICTNLYHDQTTAVINHI